MNTFHSTLPFELALPNQRTRTGIYGFHIWIDILF